MTDLEHASSRERVCTIFCVVVKLEQVGEEKVYNSSAYIAHDRLALPEELHHLTNTIATKKANLLIGCDANARHTIWGSPEINERGE